MFRDYLKTPFGILYETLSDGGSGGAASPGGGGGQAAPPGPGGSGVLPATPPGGSGAAPTGETTPNLVDVTAKDAQGRPLWYSWQDHKKATDEAARWRKDFQDLKKQIGVLGEDGTQTPPAPAAHVANNDATPAANTNEVRRLRIENAVLAEAARHTDTRAAFIDPEDAVRLADLSSVQIGGDGKVTGAAEALAALATAKPHLLRTAASATTPVNRAANPARQTPLTLEDIKKMSQKEIRERWAEVGPVLAAQKK